MSRANIEIRPATAADLPAIQAIQSYYVTETILNFSYEPATVTEMRETFDEVQAEGYPYLAAIAPGTADVPQALIGYSYVHSFRTRAAYQSTAELSIFLHPDSGGQGIGSILLTAVINALKDSKKRSSKNTAENETGVHQLVAIIAVDPEDSIGAEKLKGFYSRNGFVETGLLKRVGWKYGKWLDTRYMQLQIDHN